ncbi:MAG: pantoate--beta-alanine ligase [Pseudomonadota bacterium]
MLKPPVCLRTRSDLRDHLRDRGKIGFVPTMGALHDGHLSLVEKAREALGQDGCVVVSIFVNPKQFAPGEDLDTYPRTEAADIAKLSAMGVDVVYLPGEQELYPEGSATDVRVEGLSDLLDGIYRPHFFYGVTTVVARLFLHVQPHIAVFGEKDYQQLQIIRRMVADLGFGIEIIGGKTKRDADGLAQSSRNAYLSDTERRVASAISAALHRAQRRIGLGQPIAVALEEARAHILGAGFTKLDYVCAVDPQTLQDLPGQPAVPGIPGRLLAAAWMGQTRLIDNLGFIRS